MFSLIAQTFLPSFHSVAGQLFFIAGARQKSKPNATMALASLVASQKQRQKRKNGFSEGRGSNIVPPLAAARSANDCIV
jgi:hypothetical protein